jgi:hypothetical protein
MGFNVNRIRTKKTQSILEYLMVLAAIMVAIVINTIGVGHVVQINLEDSLNSTRSATAAILEDPQPPRHVPGEPYYVPPQTKTSNPNNTDPYHGPNYNGGYNYKKWVENNPDNGNKKWSNPPQQPGQGK